MTAFDFSMTALHLPDDCLATVWQLHSDCTVTEQRVHGDYPKRHIIKLNDIRYSKPKKVIRECFGIEIEQKHSPLFTFSSPSFKIVTLRFVNLLSLNWLSIMAIWFVEFLSGAYKIRKIFA